MPEYPFCFQQHSVVFRGELQIFQTLNGMNLKEMSVHMVLVIVRDAHCVVLLFLVEVLEK